MEPKEKPYSPMEEAVLVPVYPSQPDPEKQGDYPPLEVVGLATLSNPSEPIDHIHFVSHSQNRNYQLTKRNLRR